MKLVPVWIPILILAAGIIIPFVFSVNDIFSERINMFKIWSLVTIAIGIIVISFYSGMINSEMDAPQEEVAYEGDEEEGGYYSTYGMILPQASITGEYDDDYVNSLIEEGKAHVVKPASATTESSVNEEKYGADKLLDYDDSTCWQEGNEGYLDNIQFTFDEPTRIDLIRIRNGSAVSEEKYQQNARVKQFACGLWWGESDDEKNADIINLEDSYNSQYMKVSCEDYLLTSVDMQIYDVYTDGAKYEDTAISEVTFIAFD